MCKLVQINSCTRSACSPDRFESDLDNPHTCPTLSQTLHIIHSTHICSSASCCNAFFDTVWNACSTLIASLADVSKYGIFPFD